MKLQPEILVILVHVVLVLVYTIFILLGRSHLRREHLVPLCLIPVFGPFAALIIEFMIMFREQGGRSPDLEYLSLHEDILWTSLRAYREKGDLVPLEEAVLIDEVKARRRFMLDTLYTDPFKYLDVLNIAKYNEDVETSHYATTTISRAQKDLQLAIQKYAAETQKYPEDPKILDAYADILRKYIQSGLVDSVLLKNLRKVYSDVLDRKLTLARNDRDALIEKLRNALELKDYASALDMSELLKKYWPEDEQTWIEGLRVCIEGKDDARLKETVAEIRHREIIWSAQGRELVAPWIKAET